MAGPTVKEVLLKFGIDASNWKAAILDLGKLLEQQQKSAASAQANAKKSLQEQKAAFMEVIAGRKAEVQELQKVAAQQKVIAAQEGVRTAAARATSAEMAAQAAQQRVLLEAQRVIQAQVAARLQQERLVSAQITTQTAQMRQQAIAQRLSQGGGGAGAGGGGGARGGAGGGFFGGALGAIGSRFAGTLASGVAAGQLMVDIIESLTAKVRTFIEQSGPLQQVREQFERLANIKGYNAPQFLDQLRTATHNLVGDISLYRTANLAMQSGLNISQKQIVDLTQATVGLARAQGRDATEAINALNRTFLTGRAFTLAWVTGLDRAQLTLGGVGKGVDDLTRRQMELDKVFKAVMTRFQETGDVSLTITDRLNQLNQVSTRLFQSIATGVEKSSGLRVFADAIGKILDSASGKGQAMEEIGAALGSFMGFVGSNYVSSLNLFSSAIDSVFKALSSLNDLAKAILAPFANLVGLLSSGSSAGLSFSQRMSTIAGFFTTLADGIQVITTILGNAIDIISAGVQQMAGVIAAALKFDLTRPLASAKEVGLAMTKAIEDPYNAFVAKAKASWQSLADDVYKRQLALVQGGTISPTAKASGAGVVAPEETLQHQQQLLQLRLQLKEATDKAELAATKEKIQQEKSATEEGYKAGAIAFEAYIQQRRALAELDHQARLKEIDQNVKAQETEQRQMMELQTKSQQVMLAGIKFRLEDPNVKPEEKETLLNQQSSIDASMDFSKQESSLKTQKAEQTGKAEAEAENRGYIAQTQQLDNLVLQMATGSAKAKEAALLSITKARLAEEKSLLEDELQQGNVSAESYLQTRVGLAQRTFQAEKQEADLWLSTQEQNSQTEEEYRRKVATAAIQQEKDLTNLSIKEDDIRLKSLQSSYDSAQKILEGQLKTSQQGEPFVGTSAAQQQQIPILNSLIDLESKKLKVQQDQLTTLHMVNESSGTLNKDWVEVYEGIQKSNENLLNYKKQLADAHDSMKMMASSLDDLSQGFSAMAESFTGKGQRWMGEFARQFSVMAKRAEEFSKTTKALQDLQEGRKQTALRAIGGKKEVTPQEIMATTATSVQSSGNVLKDALVSSRNELDRWKGALEAGASSTAREIDSTVIPALSRFSNYLNSISSGKTGEMPRGVVPFNATAPIDTLAGPATPLSPAGTMSVSDLGAAKAEVSSSSLQMPSAELTSAMNQVGAAAQAAVVPLTNFGSSVDKTAQKVSESGSSNSLDTVFSGFVDSVKGGKVNMDEFSKAMSATMQVVGNAAQMITGQGGPVAAGMAGVSTGSTVGGKVGELTGIPGLGLIGGVVGGIIGIFTGEARKKTEELAKNIEASFNAVMTEISAGTQTLGQGITIQATSIQSAVAQLSGQKGGRDQLNQILPQMEQQLASLQVQQEQVTKAFDQQLTILNAPQAYQQTLSSVDQIIQKYQQYINAGGNVANANQFLQQSFQQLVQQGLQSLNQSEQDAINNALQYNDLLLQQQQLANQTAIQIQEIMGGGVSTRQMPEWMQKASQLQELQQNSQIQMDQLNQEIAVSKYKLDNEQQVFNLATTRIGLEDQLVALQNAQTTLQMQQIQALQATVGAFSTGVPTNMQSAMSALGLSSGYVPWTGEATAKPTPPVPTGIPSVDIANQAIYQQALAYYEQQANLSSSSYIQPGAVNATTAASGAGLTLGGTPYPSTSGFLNPASPTSTPVGVTSYGGTTAASSGLPPTPPVTTGVASIDAQNQAVYQQALAQYQGGGGTAASTGLSTAASASIDAAMTQQVQNSQQSLSIEQQISSLVNTRVSAETTLVNLKMQEIQADMKRLAAWQSFYGTGTNGQPITMEDLLQQTYQNRGRQGFSGFYGENGNPI